MNEILQVIGLIACGAAAMGAIPVVLAVGIDAITGSERLARAEEMKRRSALEAKANGKSIDKV